MNKFLSLMKISLINDFNLNMIFKKDKIVSRILIGILILIAYGFIAGYVGIMLYGVGSITFETVGAGPILSIGLLLTTLILIITTLTRANSYLFKSKDFEFLSSLSLPLTTIIMAKITSFLIFSYLIVSIILIPTFIVYALFVKVTIIYWFIALIVLLFLPLLVITIFSILSYLLSLLLSRLKYKNIISIVLSLVLIVGIFILSFTFGATESTDSIAGVIAQIDGLIQYLYFPSYLAKGALQGNLLYLIYFMLISVIPFIIFVLYTSKVYVYVNSKLTNSVSRAEFSEKLIESKSASKLSSLVKLEFKKFFSIPMYVINSLTGKILMIIGVGAMFISKDFSQLVVGLDGSAIVIMVIVLMLFAGGITTPTSATISLEGKNLWILKSLPVSNKEIIWSKIIVDLTFSLLATFISITLFVILGNPNVIEVILLIIAGLALSLHTPLVGILVNLKHYRLDFDLPIKVIKQGVSVILTMVIGMIYALVLGIIGFVILKSLSISTLGILLIIVGLLVITVIVELIILIKKGYKWFDEIKSL